MPDLKEQLYPSWPAQVVAHPMVTSSDEDKFRYLQVLTLLIDADDVILDEEIEYLRRMVQIFGLENGTLGKLIKFVQLPETDEMRKTMATFYDKRGYSLMMDLIFVAWSDEEFHPKERELILHCSDLLGISMDKLHVMLQMVEAIRKEDVERLNELVDEFNEVKGDPEQLRFFWSNLIT